MTINKEKDDTRCPKCVSFNQVCPPDFNSGWGCKECNFTGYLDKKPRPNLCIGCHKESQGYGPDGLYCNRCAPYIWDGIEINKRDIPPGI